MISPICCPARTAPGCRRRWTARVWRMSAMAAAALRVGGHPLAGDARRLLAGRGDDLGQAHRLLGRGRPRPPWRSSRRWRRLLRRAGRLLGGRRQQHAAGVGQRRGGLLELGRQGAQVHHHGAEGVGQLTDLVAGADLDLLIEVAPGDSGHGHGERSYRRGEASGEEGAGAQPDDHRQRRQGEHHHRRLLCRGQDGGLLLRRHLTL